MVGELVGGVEGFFEAEGSVAYFYFETGSAEVPCEGEGGGVLGCA